jgi:phosphopantothenoylcysteine decarboxylase / phosphopantothenate---cysteine ligase
VPSALHGRTIALCVTGSIAAYKAVLVARLLVQAKATVIPVMTRSASKFVGAATLAGITGERALLDMFDGSPGELHVELGARADAILVVPATADVLARFAEGRADDLVTALVLCAKGPVLAAPAMHPRMWDHPATRRNVEELERQGRVSLVGPVHGAVASGDEGMGRMAEPEAIVRALTDLLQGRPQTRAQTQPQAQAQPQGQAPAPSHAPPPRVDLLGLKLVVSAGPTTEDLDPVRFVGNRSSGKMGFAVAERAAARGARVTLITGPVSLPTPPGVSRIDVRTALEMQKALALVLGKDLTDADALVMAAAVADYRPRAASPAKLKRTNEPLVIELVPNPDLLADIGARRKGPLPYLVGFALETETGDTLVELARSKLRKKKVDLVVANEAREALSRDDNRATLVTETTADALGVMPKAELADLILDRIRASG